MIEMDPMTGRRRWRQDEELSDRKREKKKGKKKRKNKEKKSDENDSWLHVVQNQYGFCCHHLTAFS